MIKKCFVLFVYNLVSIPLFGLSLPLFLILNKKFRRSFSVRSHLLDNIQNLREKFPDHKLIWIHAASMGEFEQARPIISLLKKEQPNTLIFATFMSPSGYEARKNYPECDCVQYIPLDFFWLVSSFYKNLKPDVGIIIRYEFWPNLIWLASSFSVPLFLVNASLKENHPYGKWYAKWFFEPVFKSYQKILTVNETHSKRFSNMLGSSVFIQDVGDSRFDQVILRSQYISDEIKHIKRTDCKTLIIGSAWKTDLVIWVPAIKKVLDTNQSFRVIIVPHEIHDDDFNFLTSEFKNLTLCKYSKKYQPESNLVWFDVMGKLMQLYSVADGAYVGGGLGASVHNILEPGVYGIPVCYGPNFRRSPEGVELSNKNITTIIRSIDDAEKWITEWLDNTEKIKSQGSDIRNYILKYSGVSEKIVRLIEEG